MGNAGSIEPKAKLDRKIGGIQYEVLFNPQPFDNGACRLAFKGRYTGNGPMDGKQCVTKVFIDEAKRHYKNYQPDIKASQKAEEFAQQFNREYQSTKPLRFVLPEIATVVSIPSGNEYANCGDKIIVENFIDGKYEKFNSNGDWHSDEVAAIPAFSHYTYWKSDGNFLVCDIQGVRSSDGYTLTDPAVHSRVQGQYGPTDLGPTGMTRFLDAHECTSVCREYQKPVFNDNRKINPGRENRRTSTYTFMLNAKEVEANRYFKNRRDLPAITEEDSHVTSSKSSSNKK